PFDTPVPAATDAHDSAAAVAAPSPAPPDLLPHTPPSRPAVRSEWVGSLAVFLVAFGVTLGAFVLRDVGIGGTGGGGDYPVAPGERFAARVLVAAVGATSAALVAALPQALMRATQAVEPLRPFGAGGFALLAALLLARGFLHLAEARRWRCARELDPARTAALPAFGRVHGVARATGDGPLPARSETSPVSGLWLRERAGVYGVTRRRAGGGGRPKGQWREKVTETEVGGFLVDSDAGDGTGVAVVRWGGPAAGESVRVYPYVIARYYNGMPVRRWFGIPYEGDTRSEILLLPDGARVTAWGVLLPPGEPGGLPELVPDPVTGQLMLADDAVVARVGARDRAAAAVLLFTGLSLAAAALGLAFLGGGDPVAVAALLSTLGAALLAALVTALRWAVRLTNAARGLPDREAAALRLRQWREDRAGRLLVAAVG
ncbi:MAG TPA: hypothetical protein VM490_15225, partial [Armatimonadaceae bacterium]|nr:hypothetical protein [Armatimonadaceae bacterium]